MTAHRLSAWSTWLASASAVLLLEAWVCAIVAVAIAGSLVAARGANPTLAIILLAGALLLAGQLAGALAPRWRILLGRVANPITTLGVMLGSTWIALDLLGHRSLRIQAATVAAVFVGMVALSLLGDTIAGAVARAPRLGRWRFARPGWVTLFAIAAVAIGSIPYVQDQRPPRLPRERLPAARTGAPNVLLITLDTVRQDHLSVYGYVRDTTPNLSRLALDSTTYTRAIASGDMTLSTHASIFTSLYASEHGAHYAPDQPYGRPLSSRFETLAERLADRGYFNAAVAANTGFLASRFGFAQGFHHYDSRGHIPLLRPAANYLPREWVRRRVSTVAPQAALDLWFRSAGEVNDAVLPLLKELQERQPFFLFVNYMDAHWPYVPPKPYNVLYPGRDSTFTDREKVELERAVMTNARSVTDHERNHLISQYDGELAYLDSELGRLLDRLDELGLYDDTLIVVTSDHGEVFGERNLLFHGVSVYQDQVLVPLIIRYPEGEGGRRVDSLVSVVDVMPTILDSCGYAIPDGLRGRSLAAEDLPPLHVVSESFPSKEQLEWHPRFDRVEAALTSGSLKLITSTNGKRELYDLSADSEETHNLYASMPSVARQMEQSLETVLAARSESFEQPEELDPATLERLRRLGYIR